MSLRTGRVAALAVATIVGAAVGAGVMYAVVPQHSDPAAEQAKFERCVTVARSLPDTRSSVARRVERDEGGDTHAETINLAIRECAGEALTPSEQVRLQLDGVTP